MLWAYGGFDIFSFEWINIGLKQSHQQSVHVSFLLYKCHKIIQPHWSNQDSFQLQIHGQCAFKFNTSIYKYLSFQSFFVVDFQFIVISYWIQLYIYTTLLSRMFILNFRQLWQTWVDINYCVDTSNIITVTNF